MVTQKRAWVDSALLQRWLDLVFPVLLDHVPGKTLVWDSMTAHIAKVVKARFKANKIDMVVVPGGCTPYLQAGDIGIYKSFKDHMAPLIDEWKRSDRVQYTRGGYPRPPPAREVAAWVKKAWKSVPPDVVAKSIGEADFYDDYGEWHIAKHDVYGDAFCVEWILASMSESSREENTHPNAEEEAMMAS
ncbi:Pogo transposable element with KRAB domainlike [Phytophthora palmivora]|uniref:Pogo transposable element with KRAB domainlike n=1 Tax=Phytophthora palmivora TaxID=4796 RepID=A0A2P4YKH4_9STRA|nr:Pogo transposable element with KRAB domainlike [Phytophthora palmivora]